MAKGPDRRYPVGVEGAGRQVTRKEPAIRLLDDEEWSPEGEDSVPRDRAVRVVHALANMAGPEREAASKPARVPDGVRVVASPPPAEELSLPRGVFSGASAAGLIRLQRMEPASQRREEYWLFAEGRSDWFGRGPFPGVAMRAGVSPRDGMPGPWRVMRRADMDRIMGPLLRGERGERWASVEALPAGIVVAEIVRAAAGEAEAAGYARLHGAEFILYGTAVARRLAAPGPDLEDLDNRAAERALAELGRGPVARPPCKSQMALQSTATEAQDPEGKATRRISRPKEPII